MDSQVVTFNMIAYTLFGNRNYTKYTVNHIKSAFDNLKSAKLIRKTDSYSSTEFIVDISD